MDSRLFISTEQRRSLVVITTLLAFNANPRSCVAAGSPEFMKMLAYFKASYRFSPTNLEISLNSVRCHECSVTLQMYATRVQLFEICSLCTSQFYINPLPQRLHDRCRSSISRNLCCRKPTYQFFRGLVSQKSNMMSILIDSANFLSSFAVVIIRCMCFSLLL